VLVVGQQRLAATFAVAFEQFGAHRHGREARGDVIGRTAEEAAMHLRPRHQRLAPLDEFGVRARQLPGAIDATATARNLEGHQLLVFRRRLEVVELRGGVRDVAERGMLHRRRDRGAVDQD
jgi:hypothetical protein